jgi:multiple sugar transport system substrate-binding protein
MAELELAVMLGESEALNQVRALVDSFAARKGVKIHLTLYEWTEAWTELVQAAIHGRGPDVAAISSTWLSDLIGMNVLAPLPDRHKSRLGDKSQYFEGAWLSCFQPGDETMWSIPWFSGTHVLYYRKDWLARTGLAPEAAFATAEALDNTLAQMQALGLERPWTINTRQRSVSTVHHIYSWVLGAGGYFLSDDGKQVLFAEPEALNGMEAYFRLGRFLGPEAGGLSDSRALDLFWSGQAGVLHDGQWTLAERHPHAPAEIKDNLGIAVVPGVPFVGGSNLVVWQSSRRADLAWELVFYITGQYSLKLYTRASNLLPPRWDLFNASEVAQDPLHQQFAQAVNRGRAWPALPHTALIESKLRDIFPAIWGEVIAEPNNIRPILEKHLLPLQTRLQTTIAARA